MEDASPVLREALELIKVGEVARAEAMVAGAIDRCDEGGPAWAAAHFDLATVHLATGDPSRAAIALRVAAETTDLEDSERLTYLMNLGEVLVYLGDLDEALPVLEQCLAGREAVYGQDHPGYAYGLEPLADLHLRQGRAAEANQLAEQAAQILWDAGHPRVTALLVLRSMAHKAAHGVGEPTLEALDRLPDELLDEVVAAAIDQSSPHEPAVVVPMLLELRGRMVTRRGANDPAAVDLGIALTNVARESGDHALRCRVFEDLVEVFALEPKRQLETLMGLALALSDAGDAPGATAAYDRAVALAAELDDPRIQAITARNAGLFLADHGEPAAAEARLREAVHLSERSGDADTLARARVALGVYVQHAGHLDEAQALLVSGGEALPTGDPDALTAASHLSALRDGGHCGCGDLDGAISAALRELVLPHVPEGLLDDIAWGPEGVAVTLAREPTQPELDLLDRTVREAVELTQQRIRSGGSSRL